MREHLSAFFAPSVGENAAGLFSFGHAMWLFFTLFTIFAVLLASRHLSPRGIRRVTLYATVLLYAMELAKMIFSVACLQTENPNDLLPLYYCSLILYLGPFAVRGARVGKVFLCVGALVGGATFLLFPTTSLLRYPAFHFIAFHSFLWHGTMVYLALLWWWRGGYRPRGGDAVLSALPPFLMCAVALVFNTVYNSFQSPVANLAFLSKDFPGTPLSLLYRLCGRAFTPVMWLAQAFLPYLVILLGVRLVRRFQQPKSR
ncbi:MAG: hypothetical protein E7650_07145 [Ruminococcaceae bacterium]|nr:hypothetical protein [Oscillospiraceae bacterium]